MLLLLLLSLLLVLATARPPARSRFVAAPAPGRPPASLSVHDDFFNARARAPLRALRVALRSPVQPLRDGARASTRRRAEASLLRDELRDEVPPGVQPLWIADIVESYARPPIGASRSGPSLGGRVDWHVDKDEELYHRNRIVWTADRSFVAYLDPRSTRADGLRRRQRLRADRPVSPRLGVSSALRPGRRARGREPERGLGPAGARLIRPDRVPQRPGPLHVAEDYPPAPPPSSPEFRCLVFNVVEARARARGQRVVAAAAPLGDRRLDGDGPFFGRDRGGARGAARQPPPAPSAEAPPPGGLFGRGVPRGRPRRQRPRRP